MKKYISILFFTLFSFTALHAAPELTGTWVATVEYNQALDTYKISFSADGRCRVTVSNDSTEQETAGTWSYDGSLFRLNAAFRNAKIAYLHTIQWTSVLTFTDGNNTFTILGKAGVNSPQMRLSFFRQDHSFDEKSLPKLFDPLCEHIPLGSRLAILGIAASDPQEGSYYLEELTLRFVNARKYTVVDRSDIDAVLKEQNFQLSGYVDDDAMVSIGKFIGATVVITGTISGTGLQKRIVLKAIDVLTSEILAMSSVSL